MRSKAVPWIYGMAVPLLFLVSTIGWFELFPIKNNFLSTAFVLEGTYFLASLVAYILILRLNEKILAFGWTVFTLGLLFDFLEESTLEAGFVPDVDVIQDILLTIGLSFIAGGFLSAVKRREKVFRSVSEGALQVAASKERLTVILTSITDGIVVTDAKGKILLMNAAAELLGMTSERLALGSPIGSIFPFRNADIPHNLISLEWLFHKSWKNAIETDALLQPAEGAPKIVELVVTPLKGGPEAGAGRVWMLKDVTIMRHNEREIQNQSRLESVGHLAAGVAHDFNNILAAIQNWASLIETKEAASAELMEARCEIQAACKRGRSLSTQLITFAKGGEPIKVPTNLRDLIRTEALFALSGANVTVRFDIAPDLWHAEIDPTQISQVMQNLVINSRQASPDGGEIVVSARNLIVPDSSLGRLEAGNYVQVEVCDYGHGIPSESIGRVFDPYYSTKKSGRGLGLAICHSIIKRHGGVISVRSDGSLGTVFTFQIPATDKPIGTYSAPLEPHQLQGISVLVVDDDPAVRVSMETMLWSNGLEAESCAGGDEAVDLYQARLKTGRPFRIVFIDLTLKEQRGGEDLMQRLLKIDPQTRGIVITGYHDSPILRDYQSYGFVGGLSKPFDFSSLAGVLHSALSTTVEVKENPRQ